MHERIAGRFGRAEPRARVREYVSGLVAGLERKNGWTLAERAGEVSPDGMQRLLRRADWDVDGVRDDVRGYVIEHLGDPGGVLIADETGFIKKGTRSAGVQRQYSGTAGRTENCQVGVFLAYASPRGHALIDRELYLPRSWADDRDRCRAAGIPPAVEFTTKPRQAKTVISRAIEAKVPFAWFTADEVYGQAKYLQAWLEDQDVSYVLAIRRSDTLTTSAGEQRADALIDAAPSRSWQRISVGAGAHGLREFRWARVPVRPGGRPGRGYWLLARRSIKAPDEIARAAAQAGDPDHAEALARAITDPYDQAQALTELARAAAQAGDPDHAEALARAITDPYDQARALTELARAAAQAGDPDHASRLAADAEALARTITDPYDQAQALTGLARAAAQAGDPDHASRLAADAEALARTITDPRTQAWVLAELVGAAAQAGDPDCASRLAAEAEALARAITGPSTQARVLAELARAAAQAGDPDRAEALARTIPITDPGTQAWVLAGLAWRGGRGWRPRSRIPAGRRGRGAGPRHHRPRHPGVGARRGGWRGRRGRRPGPRRGPGPHHHQPRHPGAGARRGGRAAAQAGDPDRASRLATEAEALARTIPSPHYRAPALAGLACAAAQAGDPDRASRLAAEAEARTITDPQARAQGIRRASSRGRPGRATRTAPGTSWR